MPFFLAFTSLTAAQTAGGPYGGWFTSTSGGGAGMTLDCVNTPAVASSGTQTWQMSDFAWNREAFIHSIHNFETELVIAYQLGTFHYGNATAVSSLSVSVSDRNGPVKVYDPVQNLWTSDPIVVGAAENNYTSTMYFRLHRRADFDTLTLTASAGAQGTCLSNTNADQGWAFALVTNAALAYW